MKSVRQAAIEVLQAVLKQGKSLSEAMTMVHIPDTEQGWLQALCYGVIRDYRLLHFVLAQLMPKSLRSKDHDIEVLLLMGIYQLRSMQVAPHAAVNETVKIAKTLKKNWAVGLVNGVLREYLRAPNAVKVMSEAEQYSHPDWLVAELKQDWPGQWREILRANQQHPPMILRVNLAKTTRENYVGMLQAVGIVAHSFPLKTAVVLETPVEVFRLPKFQEGWVSVQDASAQWAALFLACQSGMRVLDACAAPGGKAVHLLEMVPDLHLSAVDQDAVRLIKVAENLQRGGMTAVLKAADVGDLRSWWDGQPFDRILLDAPCSATGVIRRHPDIKWLRRKTDIADLVAQQKRLLAALWQALKSGGRLLYATCSVLKQENHQVITAFLQAHADARLVPLDAGVLPVADISIGLQILPGEGDGFYYAALEKMYKNN